MSITERARIIKYWFNGRSRSLFIAGLIIVVSVGSFSLGRLSANDSSSLEIVSRTGEAGAFMAASATAHLPKPPDPTATLGEVVGSKTSGKYYFPWCGAARAIREENKRWFSSVEVAQAAGFTPGANCKGLH